MFSILKKSNSLFQPILLAAIILLSRLPFLGLGYGAEEDSWGTPLAIWNTIETDTYEPSRLPGHPVQEAFYLLVAYSGPFAFNIFSALACVGACLAFFYIFKKLNFQNGFISALALGFTPVIYISSTYTIDYCLTLCFLLWAFYFLLDEKPLLTGIFLALAVGCRITTGIMILPFCLWLYTFSPRDKFIKSSLQIFGTMTILGCLAYWPLIYNFGYRFFHYYDLFPYPPIEKIIYKASFGVWGVLGLLGIISASISQLIFFRNRTIENPTIYKKPLIALFAIVFFLFLSSYIRLPQKSGYWITVIPFAILFLRVWLNQMLYTFTCICIIASSFFFSLGLTDSYRGSEYSRHATTFSSAGQTIFLDPITGPMYADYTKRVNKEKFCEEVINSMLSQPKDSLEKQVLICGWWYNELMTESKVRKLKLEKNFGFYLPKRNILDLKKEGKTLYFLPEQAVFNDQYSGMEDGFTAKTAGDFEEAFISSNRPQ